MRDWKLERLLSPGPLFLVYQGRPASADGHTPAAYAIKVLDESHEKNPACVAVVQREAVVGRKVCHPHLAPVLASHVSGPPYYVVLPWLPGATLAEHLATSRRPITPLALWIVRQIAEALAALDAAGWMHCDIKPSNVLVASDGHATLIDLGFAQQSGDARPLADRPVLGTLAYMPPEALTSSLHGDIRGDIYSLGVLLFELLTGALPFQSDQAAELARQHLEEGSPDVRSLAPHVPSTVAQLVRMMLAKQPLRRPQSPGELVRRLVRLEIETYAEWELASAAA